MPVRNKTSIQLQMRSQYWNNGLNEALKAHESMQSMKNNDTNEWWNEHEDRNIQMNMKIWIFTED